MNDLNSFTGIGRLVRDAETKVMPNGDKVANFTIALNGSKKVGDTWEDNPSFVDCVHWCRHEGGYFQYLLKGKQVAIIGELRQDRWETKDGDKRSKVVIVARNIQLLGSAKDSDGGRRDEGSDEPIWEKEAHPAASSPQRAPATKSAADNLDDPDFIF